MTQAEPVTVADVLRLAARLAEKASTTRAAVSIAWAALHREPSLMHPAFVALNRHVRGHDTDIPGLGDVMRRQHRHGTPGSVAGTLRAAADQVERGELI